MTNWKPINNASGAPKRTKPAVQRIRTTKKTAQVIFPACMHGNASATDVFTDGNGRIAYRLHYGGSRKMWPRSKGGADRVATIPAEFVDFIPFGTTDVHLEREGDLLILDLAQFKDAEK